MKAPRKTKAKAISASDWMRGWTHQYMIAAGEDKQLLRYHYREYYLERYRGWL